jgi:hypothetical protein
MSVRQGNSVIAGGIPIDNTPTSSSSNAVSSGGVYTALGGKVDIDASNFNTTGKATIVVWGMPDYSAAVSQSWGVDYTATEDCLIYTRSNSQTTTYIQIGGVDYMLNNNAYQVGIFIPMPKGQTYKLTGGSGSDKVVIKFPLKGVA